MITSTPRSDAVMVPIDQIIVKDRYRKDLGDLSDLKSSISNPFGLLADILITADGTLIAGERRYESCKALNWSEVPCKILSAEAAASLKLKLMAERDENLCRKDPSRSEKVALANAIEKQIGKRQGVRTSGKADSLPAGGPEVRKGEETRQAVARLAGFGSEKQLRKAKIIVDNGSSKLQEAVEDKLISETDAAAVCSQTHEIQNEALRRALSTPGLTLRKAVASIKAEQIPEQAEAVVDCRGVNVPDNIRTYFDATVLFDEIAEKTRAVRLLLNKLDKHPIRSRKFAGKNNGQLQSYCTTIEGDMERERFGCVCPLCNGIEDGKLCKGCEGARWLTAGYRDNGFPWKVHGVSPESNTPAAKGSK